MKDAQIFTRRADGALITGILVIAVLYFAREVFVPLALAGLLAFLLAPAANRLERLGLKRTPSALLIILLSVSGVAAISWVTLGQVYNLALELPQYQQNVTEKLESLHLNSPGRLASTVEMLSSLSKEIENGSPPASPNSALANHQQALSRSLQKSNISPSIPSQPVTVRVEQPSETIVTVAARSLTPLIHPLATAFIVAVFLVFILIGREDLLDRGLRLAGNERVYVTTTAIGDASHRVSRYLQMQLAVNLMYGVITGLLLLLIGVPHALLWGLLTCLLRFVPYIGILMAAIGPLFLSIAASPHWGMLLCTVLTFVVLETVTANFVEPLLYGSSTGMSAIAILTAAIFWTLLWGFPGLLLSTPLTVCLVVMGKQFPHLQFLEVLFGEQVVLPASDRFYQRLLASNSTAAKSVVEEMMKTHPRAEVYDDILIPALSQIEEARHSEQMTSSRAEELLQGIEELPDEPTIRTDQIPDPHLRQAMRLACVPARDFADEIACQLISHVLDDTALVSVSSSDFSTPDLLQFLEELGPEIVCVIGVPPHVIRHLQMRCHQIRNKFPDMTIVACMLSKDSELSKIRSRISTYDAQHVVCSMQLLREYLISLHPPIATQDEERVLFQGSPEGETAVDVSPSVEVSEEGHELRAADLLYEYDETIFTRLATDLARSFDAPIALINGGDRSSCFWSAQCGLPETEVEMDSAICSRLLGSQEILVIPDTAEAELAVDEPFFQNRSIRFFAGALLKTHEGQSIGSLCVLDTRPRQITEEQRDSLASHANAVMTAIELHASVKTTDSEVGSQAALEEKS